MDHIDKYRAIGILCQLSLISLLTITMSSSRNYPLHRHRLIGIEIRWDAKPILDSRQFGQMIVHSLLPSQGLTRTLSAKEGLSAEGDAR
jgi:hypothetical protein